MASQHTQHLIDQLEAVERAGGAGDIDFGRHDVLRVSNLAKVWFPKTGHTKGDVMRYYARMWPRLKSVVADRPLVMRRFPNGVNGKAFYQHRAPADAPDIVRIERVADAGIQTLDRIVGGDLPTLLYTIQLGAISVDPWHSRVHSIGSADYTIVDLDPAPKATFARVAQVALWVKEELDALGLHGIAKTSGASGIHVVLPLAPGVSNEMARTLAQLVATRVTEKHPRETTVERSVGARAPTSVYVDFLQNIRGKTVAGAYSARSQPQPSVSTPLRWDELENDLDPRELTIDTIPERVRDVGDLWATAMKRRNRLPTERARPRRRASSRR